MTAEHADALPGAAVAYVLARIRQEGASPADLVAASVDVDDAWHQLHRAAGYPVLELCDECNP